MAADQTPASISDAHRHREIAESFGAIADRYDRTRPRYPSALADAVAQRMPGTSMLDVGIGTGISAEPFRDRGFRILGVEPDPQMAAVARGKGFDVELGRFEQWDAAGRMFDGVIAGQTWHWVDAAAGAAKAATVLRPGGLLAVFWNEARPPAALAEKFAAVFASLDTGLPFNPFAASTVQRGAYGGMLDAAEAGLRAAGGFGGVERLTFDWQADLPGATYVEALSTSGGMSRLPQPVLDRLLAGIGAAVDAAGGHVVVDYTTVAGFARRSPD